MSQTQIPLTIQKWTPGQQVVAATTVIASFWVWIFLMANNASFQISIENYGFPLTYLRRYNGDFDRFFLQALIFDGAIGILIAAAVGFCAGRGSSNCSSLPRLIWCVTSIGFAVSLFLAPWILPRFGVIWLLLLFGVVLLWFFCLCYSSATLWTHLFRSAPVREWVFVPMVVLVGLGWCCSPHDVFYWATRGDIPELREGLFHQDPRYRVRALDALRGLGPFDEPTCRAVLPLITDDDHFVRDRAASLVAEFGPFAVEAVPILTDWFVKTGECTHELAHLGRVAHTAIPALKSKLDASQGYEKLGICRALWEIEHNPETIIPALIELCGNDFRPIKRDAIRLLGDIGPAAISAVPYIESVVAHPPAVVTPPANVSPANVSPFPTVREMTDAEFFPQLREAADSALRQIKGTR